ncbi:MAG TPA: UDP-3-O-acyl-N-acetylglucosamine deacetylase, partial [Chroococcales cyanobacterium]
NRQHQRTLRSPIELRGIGLHSGRPVSVTLLPAEADRGITFVRRDLPGLPSIPALAEYVSDTTLSTTLSLGPARVQTVEHVMAALAGLAIDNATVLVDAAEMPVLDGSALPYVTAILQKGIQLLRTPRRFLEIHERIEIQAGDRKVIFQPNSLGASVTYVVDYHHPLAGPQLFEQSVDPADFAAEIAPARTFCFLKDVEWMQENGLALGGNTENAVIICNDGYSTPLRFIDEFVRHKALDLIGDLALVGMPWHGQVIAVRAGHSLHTKLASQLRAAVYGRKEAIAYAS